MSGDFVDNWTNSGRRVENGWEIETNRLPVLFLEVVGPKNVTSDAVVEEVVDAAENFKGASKANGKNKSRCYANDPPTEEGTETTLPRVITLNDLGSHEIEDQTIDSVPEAS